MGGVVPAPATGYPPEVVYAMTILAYEKRLLDSPFMLCLEYVPLDGFCFRLASAIKPSNLRIRELRNPGARIDGFFGRQVLRRRSGSAGCRKLLQRGLPAATAIGRRGR